MRKLIIVIILVLMIFLISCTPKNDMAHLELTVEEKCVQLCKTSPIDNIGFWSNGGCLSNEVEPDWVCDIAHSPRQDIDNLPENQCSSYVNGEAKHFVEVTQDCQVIRKV